jgi:hypothetical protein
MGPCEHPSTHPENQAKGKIPQQKKRARRPRSRMCLLKGCGRVFRPEHPMARYCSEHCRNEAAQWRKWKARQQYRQTAHGKQVRRAQSRRYRVRQREQKKQKANALSGARVITRKFFFVLLRSPWVIRRIPTQPAVAAAALLFLCMSSGSRTSSGAGEALVGAPPQPAMNSLDLVPIY